MRWVALGAALGVLSRVEEVTAGFSAGISSNSAWALAAFAAGATAPRAWAGAAAVGAVALSAANAGYYAWIALTEPGTDLASVAGAPARWLVLGLVGGFVLALAGHLWSTRDGRIRVLASLPLAAAFITEGIDGLHGFDAIGLVAGLAFPIASARSPRQRLAAATAVAATATVAALGVLAPLNP